MNDDDNSGDDSSRGHYDMLNTNQSKVKLMNSITIDSEQQLPPSSTLESAVNGNNSNILKNDENLINLHTDLSRDHSLAENNEITVWNDCNVTMPSLDLSKHSSTVSSVKSNVVQAINTQLLNEIDRSHKNNPNVSKDHDLMSAMNDSNNVNRPLSATATVDDCKNASTTTLKINSSDILNSEQEDFKRLNTYCTLRPQQRRKILLNVLPALRHTSLLRSLLAQRTETISTAASTATIAAVPVKSVPVDNERSTNNDLDTFLNNLDELMMGKRGYINNAGAASKTLLLTNFFKDHLIGTRLLIGAENVENCLLELDHYLEEIDRGGGGGGSKNLIRPLIADDQNNINNNSILRNALDNENNVVFNYDTMSAKLNNVNDFGHTSAEKSKVQLNNRNGDRDCENVASKTINSDNKSGQIVVNEENNAYHDDMLDDSVFSKISKRMSCSDWDLDCAGGTAVANDIPQHQKDFLTRRIRARCTISAFKDISAFARGAERDRTNGKLHSKCYFQLVIVHSIFNAIMSKALKSYSTHGYY